MCVLSKLFSVILFSRVSVATSCSRYEEFWHEHFALSCCLYVTHPEAFGLLPSWHFPFLGNCCLLLTSACWKPPLNLLSLSVFILKITGKSHSPSTAAFSVPFVPALNLDKQNQSRPPTFQLSCGVTLHVWQWIFKCCGKVKNNIFKYWSRIFLSLTSGQSFPECVCAQTDSGDSLRGCRYPEVLIAASLSHVSCCFNRSYSVAKFACACVRVSERVLFQMLSPATRCNVSCDRLSPTEVLRFTQSARVGHLSQSSRPKKAQILHKRPAEEERRQVFCSHLLICVAFSAFCLRFH